MTLRRFTTLVLITAVPLFAACGSSNDPAEGVPASSSPPAPAATLAAAAGLGDVVEVMAGAIDDGYAEACHIERKTLETATEAYYALNGAVPTSQEELVGTLIKEPITSFEYAADGTVQPVAGGRCVGL